MARLVPLVPLLATALLVSSCGGSDGSKDADVGTTAAATVKTGGTLTGDYVAYPDSLDPALAYTQEAWTVLWPVYTSLLTYRHAEGSAGAQLLPGLAEALPDISADGKTYRLKLRPGLTYSDGSAVKASDVTWAIKRVLHLQSGGVFLFEGIEGAADYEKAKSDDAPLEGIETDDATGEITFHLTAADPQFSFALAMIFSAPVPASTPMEPVGTKPALGVGPFALTDVKSSRGFTLEKVPGFKSLPNVPVAKADKIVLSVVQNQRRQAQDVIGNEVDFLESPPIADQLPAVRQQAADRFKTYPTNSTYYFFLNSKVPPFDDPQVRLAVGTAVDDRALARIYGGLMDPDCNFLPPGVAGYQKLSPCPFGDPEATPDLAKAKSMIQAAGATGAKVTTYSDDNDTSNRSVAYLTDVMNQIGLDAKQKVVSADNYFQTVGNATTKAQSGFLNWFQDYPSPANFFQNIDADNIQPRNNPNVGNVDDPEIQAALKKANASPDPEKVAGLYASIDRRLVSQAYVIPWGHAAGTKLTSDRVAFGAAIYHPVNGLDLTSLGLK